MGPLTDGGSWPVPGLGIGPVARGIGPVPARGIGPEFTRGIGPVPAHGMGPVSVERGAPR